MKNQKKKDGELTKPKLTRSEIARLGGLATRGKTSEAKAAAARENGKKNKSGKGGRPRKYATASERQKAYLERKRKSAPQD